MKVNFIFIGGIGHSGTTLLQKILCLHSKIISPYGWLENPDTIFNSSEMVTKWNVKYPNKTILCKNPKNALYINKIKKLYPKSKIILMYRNGRDVALSMNRRGKFQGFTGCVEYWNQRMKHIWKYHNDPNVMMVKYEHLAEQPETLLLNIQEYIGLDSEKLIWKYNKQCTTEIKKPKTESGNDHKKLRKWQINQPINKDTSRWKTDMDQKQQNIFFEIAGKTSKMVGYQ